MQTLFRKAAVALTLTTAAAGGASAQDRGAMNHGSMGASAGADVMVGGQAMLPSRDIVANAVNSADHTTLVAAVEAAGLVETLQGKGPFTVFAPTNAAFALLPDGTVATLLEPANQKTLAGVLTYHVVPGSYDAMGLMQAIRKGNGKATMKTAAGGELTFMMNGARNVVVRDSKGTVASISTYDVKQSNGVIHVIDRVLLP